MLASVIEIRKNQKKKTGGSHAFFKDNNVTIILLAKSVKNTKQVLSQIEA